MLAQTFKTASQLGISEAEQRALITVLHGMEDGTINEGNLYMPAYHTSCGTAHCIAGWATMVDPKAFPWTKSSVGACCILNTPFPKELLKVFGVGSGNKMANKDQAMGSLRTYLETGEYSGL